MGDTSRASWRRASAIVLSTGIVYGLLAWSMWQIDPSWGSAFWPAAGVTVAVCLRSPTTRWPALAAMVFAAEVAVNRLNDMSWTTSLWGGLANAVEPVVSAGLFVRLTGGRREIDVRTIGWFVFAAVLVGPAVGAVFGGLLAVPGPMPPPERWLRWFVGDGVGVLAVAPVVLAGLRRATRWRRPEAFALVSAMVTSGGLLVLGPGPFGRVAPYLAVPVLVWAALRFGVSGAAVAATCTAAVVHVATATGHGSFVTAAGSDLVVAQVYIGVFALSALTIAVLVEDVEARRRSEQALLHRALHDPLTGLANRAKLDLHLSGATPGAVLLVDLDGFKEINDSHGHAVGDAVLRGVAARLGEICAGEVLLARLGGDEFVLTLPAPAGDEEVRGLVSRIHAVLAGRFVVGEASVRVGASVGIARGRLGATPADLLAEADRAMYRAKAEANQYALTERPLARRAMARS